MSTDELFMTEAIALAKKAEEIDEVPVGALIVHDGKVIAEAYKHDKKATNDKITVIFVKEIGKYEMKTIDLKELIEITILKE